MKKLLLFVFVSVFSLSIFAQVNEDFESGEQPAGWLTVTPTFDEPAGNTFKWHPADYGGNSYMRASAFAGSNFTTEQWLVTPVFSTMGASYVELSFDNETASYPGPDLQVFVSADFAGDSASIYSATWTEVTDITLSTGVYEFVTSTSDLTSYSGNENVYVAFKYTSTDSEGAVWDVDNVVITTTTGVHNLSSGTSIYPNPVKNTLNIKAQSNIASVEILNVIGQRVMVQEAGSANVTLNTESLKNGVYFVKTTNMNGVASITKIIKK